MNQTRTQSMLEASSNIAIGFIISLAVQLIWFPAIGHDLSLTENVSTTLVFTLVSLFRSYVVRRAFNHLGNKERTE